METPNNTQKRLIIYAGILLAVLTIFPPMSPANYASHATVLRTPRETRPLRETRRPETRGERPLRPRGHETGHVNYTLLILQWLTCVSCTAGFYWLSRDDLS